MTAEEGGRGRGWLPSVPRPLIGTERLIIP